MPKHEINTQKTIRTPDSPLSCLCQVCIRGCYLSSKQIPAVSVPHSCVHRHQEEASDDAPQPPPVPKNTSLHHFSHGFYLAVACAEIVVPEIFKGWSQSRPSNKPGVWVSWCGAWWCVSFKLCSWGGQRGAETVRCAWMPCWEVWARFFPAASEAQERLYPRAALNALNFEAAEVCSFLCFSYQL